jgi:gp16 family phage-associated protein
MQSAAFPQPLAQSGGTTKAGDVVRAAFRENGIVIADWARERGFSVELTRMVLAGKRKCLRGQSHQIAIALGIKQGPAMK